MIKVLAACGAGVNSSHQIKDAIESEFKNRGYNLHCDAVMIKDVNEEMLSQYDIFAQIAKTDFGFKEDDDRERHLPFLRQHTEKEILF